MKTLIKNGRIFINNEIKNEDILLNNDKVESIGHNLNGDNVQVIDAQNKLVTPGLVDVHVHFRDPGFTDKETIHSGSEAAAHGGYTTVCAMPNVKPVPDTPEKVAHMCERNQKEAIVHVKQYSSITQGRLSDVTLDYQALKEAGAIGFSNDGNGIQSAATMMKAMAGIKQTGLPLAEHVEDEDLKGKGVMNAGKAADRLHLPGMSDETETSQLARDLELAEKTGVHYHMCHVSTKRSVELIRNAKLRGINVTAEVTPHHLLLDESNIDYDNPNYKMNPPLRTYADRQALIGGLLDGTIDMIATDHAPHTKADKGSTMLTGAFGITGLETTFSLLYTHFVKPGYCSLAQLLQWMSVNPAKIFNLKQAGAIEVGKPADLAIFDLNQEYSIAAKDMLSKGLNSPFIGQHVFGKTVMTIVDGKVVYQEAK